MDDRLNDGTDDDSSGFRGCFISSAQNASYIDAYPNNTLADFTLNNIIFKKNSKIISSKSKYIVKDNSEYLGIFRNI
jgi:PKD repeat protein